MVDDEEMAKGPKSPLTIARERKGLNRSQLARLAGTY